MSIAVRRFFFWCLVTVFLVTTPAIVLFLMGYRYSFERGVFVYTGSVTIQANPSQNLDIRIDNQPISSSTNRINRSFHIEGIKPGTHRLSISAPGFKEWSKEISVKSGISTEFWNVLLARAEYAQTAFEASRGTLAFFPAEDERVALLSEQDGETTITILDRTNGERRQIFSTTQFSPKKDGVEHHIRWSPRQDNFLIVSLFSKENSEEHTFIVGTDDAQTTDLKDILRVPHPRSALWSPYDDAVFFLSENNLYRTPLNTKFGETLISNDIAAYDFSDGKIFSVESESGRIQIFSENTPKQKIQKTFAIPKELIKNASGKLSLIVYDETRIAILDRDSGSLFLSHMEEENEQLIQLSSNAKGAQFSDDGKKLLHWSDWEIAVFFTREWNVQPTRKEGERLDIGRFSRMIDHVQWGKSYEHILFSSENELRIIELDDRGGRNASSLTSFINTPTQISSLGNRNEILFLVRAGTESETTAPPLLSSIIFPEPIGFFSFK